MIGTTKKEQEQISSNSRQGAGIGSYGQGRLYKKKQKSS